MTKQELLKEELWLILDNLSTSKYLRDQALDKVLALLKENNYVRLSDDQSLPELMCKSAQMEVVVKAYELGQQDMLHNDFRRVELNETTKD